MDEWRPLRHFFSDKFQENTEALRRFHPDIYETILPFLENNSVFLRSGSHGYFECARRENGQDVPWFEAEAIERNIRSLRSLLAGLRTHGQTGLIYLMGWELGYAFTNLQERHLRLAHWKVTVAIEPQPCLFAASLAIHSLQDAFASSRVFFAIGDDWKTQLIRLIREQNLFSLSRIEAFESASAALVFPVPLRTQVRQITEPVRQTARLQFEQEFRTTVNYYFAKPADHLKKIMAYPLSGGMAVSYIHKRFLDECEAQGIEVVYHRPSVLDGIDLLRAIAREKPDCLVMVNLAPDQHAPLTLINQMRLPRLFWYLDDPQNIIGQTSRFGPHDFVFSWDCSYEDFFRAQGAQSVDHFPFVADLDHCQPHDREEFRSPISYVGQVAQFIPEEHGLDSTTARLVWKAGREKAVAPHRDYRSLVLEYQDEFDRKMIRDESDSVPRSICYAIYTVANALRRIHILEKARPFGLRLYGNSDWLPVLGDHPLRECYQGPADPVRDVPDIFFSSQINLNIHSLHARSSLNQRDFNCPLLGGFLLTDWVPGAEEFFEPDQEMVFYHDEEDLQNKLRFFLEHPESRVEIIKRGQERVLRDHTYIRRVPRVLETLRTRIRERYPVPSDPL